MGGAILAALDARVHRHARAQTVAAASIQRLRQRHEAKFAALVVRLATRQEARQAVWHLPHSLPAASVVPRHLWSAGRLVCGESVDETCRTTRS
eukprot:4746854-Prymnesium_polylepis.1